MGCTRTLLVLVLLALLVLTVSPSAVDARPVPTPCWLLPMPYTCEPSEFPVPQQAPPAVSTDQGMAITFTGDADQLETATFIGDADQLETATEASAAQLPDGGSGP